MNFDGARRKVGSVLIVTLLMASVLGITLGSYLYWVRTQNVLITQSQAWNSALALAEAGIEEGLAQINVNVGAGDPSVVANYGPSTVNNFGSLGNTIAGAYGPKPNTTLSNGWYSVIIVPPTNALTLGPTIIATGYTTVPFIGKPLSRTVQVTTTIKSLLANGITATTDVTLKGNGLNMDSYDSSDLVHFPGGFYNATNRMAGGDVASLYGIVGIQNANIYGHLMTGATDTNAPSIGANGRVGDLNWAGPGIEAGWWLKDFNMDVPDIGPPYTTSGLTFPTAVSGNGTNLYLLTGGSYYVPTSLQLGNNDVLEVSGNTSLYITGDNKGNGFNMNNNAVIKIDTGASLKLYIGTSTGSAVNGSLGMVNTIGNATTFTLYGLPSLTSLTWKGNAAYLGTVYAPEASFTLGGGGSTDYDFQGALTVKSITMNGHFSIHYDQNLRRIAPSSGFTVASWREL